MNRIEVDRGESFTYWLFFRKDSRRAADALINELRKRRKLTEREMSRFAKMLESGELGFKFSRNNFYRHVLHTFVDLGFVGKSPAYDETKRRAVQVYRAILQPIPSKRPSNPSFWSVTYGICKWWNDMMVANHSRP